MGRVGEPLIGVEDMETPRWAEGYAATANAGLRAVAAKVPATVALAVRWAWRASPPLTLLAGVVQLAAGAVTAFGLLATADVFTQLLAQGPTPERVVAALPAIATVVAAGAARGLLDAAVAAVQGALVPRVEQRAQDDLHAAVLRVDLAAFDDADFTELVERASSEGPSRIRSCAQDTGDLMASLVSVSAAVVSAGVLHPVLAPVVLLAALPRGWATVRSARLMFASFVRMTSARRRSSVTRMLITGRDPAAEVRAFTTQPVLLGEHRRISDLITAEAVRLERDRAVVQLVGRTVSGVGTGLAYGVLALLLYAGGMPLALAGAAALAMRTAGQSVANTIYEINHLYEASFYLDLYRSCLDETRRRSRPPAAGRLPGDPAEITLTDVSFRYPGQEQQAVNGVSCTLRRGEVIALVGENGSGKSTLAKLITGLYLAESGTVSWDGVDIATVDQRELHERVAVVFQDPLRWPMHAENNVRIGRLDRPDPGGARLADAAARSGTDAVVAELPGGWSTVLSREFQGGRDLSGGQWQRFSVARGLYRDAPVVIADEPTAALDARAEHAVFAALRGLAGTRGDRITVLVTHRLANVKHADQILVLEQGRLIEHGTHEQLIARGGTYRELFTLQASAYTDEGDARDTVPA
ncbi:ATP-binding cassette subfamily B protein [Pseudonocardia hierapolitana]|uniref:ATP-binding cassette subfamily B protein n=1 Tax=Pseudonocardia hierapolitana TaxID=1128676 RepID=A0A561SIZ8_9PSEU|nr:ATP-binding cassette subfamily B protein [Pseudonocardia hierapolitana]